MLKIAEEKSVVEQNIQPTLDDLARDGARRMLMEALELEVAEYIERHQERDENGRALVVRNGLARERHITIGSGTLPIRSPRVNDKRVDGNGERARFTSQILPPYMRRSPEVAEVLPILYLRGLSTGDFAPALKTILGKSASGLSATNITRMTQVWKDEYDIFRKRDLSEKRFVYVWADGIHFRVRLEDDRLCTLVLIGVREDGNKELIAVEDGYRESTESWADVLRNLKARGMEPPLLAVADGALGFWAAARQVWPETKEQRCWVHKLSNVLDKLPKRLQGKAKAMLHEIMKAPSRKDAKEAAEAFREAFEAKYPKAANSLTKDLDSLLTFYDFPAEHWRHIRTTNAIESSFATVRLRQRVTKGAGNRTKALTMAYKLLEMAQLRWRRIAGYALVPEVLAGAAWKDGERVEIEVEVEDTVAREENAA